MEAQQFAIAKARLVIIKNGKVLLVNNLRDKFYYFIGGKVNSGETLLEAAKRELTEECNEPIDFKFKKVLYIKDHISNLHSLHGIELFLLGETSKFEELEGRQDPEHGGQDYMTWVDISKINGINLKPEDIRNRLQADYERNFENIQGEYLV